MVEKLDQPETEENPHVLARKISTDVQKPVTKPNQPSEFTEIVGGHGAWQRKILFITLIGGIPTAWNHLIISFYAFPQDHWCAHPFNSSMSTQEWWNSTIPNETMADGIVQHSQCNMYVTNNSDGGRIVARRTVPCKEWEFAPDYGLTIISQFGLVCEKEWMVSMSQSVYMAGFLAAVLISGQLADTYGRHPVILLNIGILLIFGLATAFSTSFIMFTIMRFFVAMGQAGLSLTLFVLMIEIVGAEHRALFAFLQGIGWHIGYMVLPLLAWLLPNWQHLQLITTVPCLLFISFYWIIPESPRWLLTHGKIDKAIQEMEKAAKVNKIKVKDLEVQAKKLCCVAEIEEESKNNATVIDLLSTPNLRKKTLNLYFCWTVIAFVYYGLSLNTGELGGNFFLNFFLSGLVEVPATITCIIVLRLFGRRIPFMTTLVGGGIACIGCIFIPSHLQWLKVTLAMLGKLFVSSSFSIVYVYSAEIYPTVARNVGVGSSSTMGRIGSMVAPFMKELGKVTNTGVPLGIFGGLSILSGLLVLLLPETKGHPIPETIQQAEEFGKKKKVMKTDNMECELK